MSPLLEGEFALWSAEMNESSETASPRPHYPGGGLLSPTSRTRDEVQRVDSAFLGVGWELCENGKGDRGLGVRLLNPTGSSWEQPSKDRGDGNRTRGLCEGPQESPPQESQRADSGYRRRARERGHRRHSPLVLLNPPQFCETMGPNERQTLRRGKSGSYKQTGNDRGRLGGRKVVWGYCGEKDGVYKPKGGSAQA